MAQQQVGIGSTFSYDPSTLPPAASSGSKKYSSLQDYQNDPANQAAFNDWNHSQSGYVGKDKKAEWWSQGYGSSQAANGLDNYMNGQRQLVVGGDANQKMGSLEGLSRGSLLYGQTMAQSGDNIQKAVGKYSDRLDGTDPVTEALKQQKNQSQANVQRNMAGRGVAGGVAAAATEQAGRQKDIDIAASAYQQNAQNLKDYTNLNSNIAANQGMLEQVYRGNAIAGVQLQPVQQQGGLLQQLFG